MQKRIPESWHPSLTTAGSFTASREVIVCLVIACMIGTLGCHRHHYRNQADAEAYCLLDQKSASIARPPNRSLRMEVDRQSRMFNPFDLDFQPMPLDDPASYQLMQCVDGRRGYPMWEAAGFTNTTESPDWWQSLPLDEDGVLELDLDHAVQIALLHSPEYQRQVEQLYLSALGVSAQRFEFDTKFFGGAQTSLQTRHESTGGVDRNTTTVSVGTKGPTGSALSLQRRFATGADLVVGLANTLVWQVSGPDSSTATTLFDFALLQPLLRGAGRDIVLEDLTEAERDLLAQVRSFERFRRSFYLNITIGRSLESQGTSTSANNLPSVTSAIGNIGNASGYLGLLQTRLRIRNLQENIVRQTENLLNFEDSLIERLTTIPDDAASIVQLRLLIAQAEQSLLSSQTRLVNQQTAYEASVDRFLRTLGLPPYLCLRLTDPILERFELIEQDLLKRREQLSHLRIQVGQLNVRILERSETSIDEESQLPITELEWDDELASTLKDLQSQLEPLVEFVELIRQSDLPAIQQDISSFEASIEQRRQQTVSLQKRYEQERDGICGLLNLSSIDESIFEMDELRELEEALNESYADLTESFETYSERAQELVLAIEALSPQRMKKLDEQELAEKVREEVIIASQRLLSDIGDDVLALQLIQARARTESVLLPQVEMDPESAFYIAKRNRRDYANAKAALVDRWRDIEIVADPLESSLSVRLSGNLGTVGQSPTDLRTNTSQLRVGLQWDAPITRLLERNNYRTELIQYEQSRRAFYSLEDNMWQLLRAETRQLQSNRLTFELGRRAIRIAARQIELNSDIRALNEARGRGAGPTAARDTINALNSLLSAQNDLLGIFVNYEVVRRSLAFDLGTMELSPEGLWIDPQVLRAEDLVGLPGTTAEGLSLNACNECCLPRRLPPTEPSFGVPLSDQTLSDRMPSDRTLADEAFSDEGRGEETRKDARMIETEPADDVPTPSTGESDAAAPPSRRDEPSPTEPAKDRDVPVVIAPVDGHWLESHRIESLRLESHSGKSASRVW